MIEEDYVSFEVAKLLKEKGFIEPCRHYYFSNGKISESKGLKHRNSSCINTYSAPTIQRAMKWFRKVHKIYIEPRMSKNTFLWGYRVSKPDGSTFCLHANTFNGCEDACDAGLKVSSENLI